MASLQQLLAQQGFQTSKNYIKTSTTMKLPHSQQPEESTIPEEFYICHGPKSLDFSRQTSENPILHHDRDRDHNQSFLDDSNSNSLLKDDIRRDEPAIDEVAIKAVISILTGHIGRYCKDESFRRMIREKCNACLLRRRKEADNGVFVNMAMGIESIDKVVEGKVLRKELRTKLLRNSIRLLSIVASLNSRKSRSSSTCGVLNSNLSVCAQLYLSIVYKLQKNDRLSSRHLLQVFCDLPFLARTHLLPDLWEHFFLPHLLHLKVWYLKELEFLSSSDYGEKEKRMKTLNKVYNDQMDMGTCQFALYYKEWLKVGAAAPAAPVVPLPSRPSSRSSRRRSSDSYASSHSIINKSLYQAVFGPTTESGSTDFDSRNGAAIEAWEQGEEEKMSAHGKEGYKDFNYVHGNKTKPQGRSRSSQSLRNPRHVLWQERQKSDYLKLFICQSLPTECLINGNHVVRSSSVRKEGNNHLLSTELTRAIATLCSSDNLSDCEIAVRVITKTWLQSHGDPATETTFSKAPIIEGMLEVLFASNDDEILELAISILAEFVSRNKSNKQIILNSDPQLEIFVRLLRSSSLFLKAAILLYLLKPKAKQMVSAEFVPLILRVLEFGDQVQTLFTVRCSPRSAAFYLLDQLLTGFDEDMNLENACEVVSLGGLSLLLRSIEIADDVRERNNAASIICCAIRANPNCRNYLADNVNKASLLELIVLGNHNKYSTKFGFGLLTELLCLDRTCIIKFLEGLKEGWAGLNTMHIFLVYLQNASKEEQPLVAAILLQLDLLGDPSKCSVYREEAIDVLIAALDCQICDEKVQEQSARALMMLGGRFSYTGETTTEKWLLEQAGFWKISGESFHCNETEEEVAAENWQRKAARTLLNSGKEKLLGALAKSIVNGTPNLAQASLFTVAWISNYINWVNDEKLGFMASSILVPQLIESSNYDRVIEERVLAAYSLQNIVKCPGIYESMSLLSSLDKELLLFEPQLLR
ncbi:putative E3 ubiquitin-protein ligase LIN-1 isoform X2 [Carica papaya]|uniref:putative E3 ubiquitin-protein ligase LIN-1 isoform X2 n=1 Tax=Carica papaya TaxID=3649 RepID=UPI000B8D0899|nr:putative E3 ubiquitin-protein ligase LIN-1 isoform X2 [Carica papaya]